MADSKRQKLVTAIVARLEEILVADGYETDLGLNVADSKPNWNEADLPAVSVFDTVADVDFVNGQPTAAQQMFTLPVLIRIFLAADDNPATARKYLADVVEAIGTDPFWNVGGVPLALWTKLTKEGLILPAENLEVAGAAVELEIAYLTQTWNSYS
ncbi:MAG TPA: hypothetical protein PLX39_17270 [Pyrinomonadaceae bacterium]|nr:hypothetical protein [Pyrinomonadaceae bacterium]